ncbi:unnamed protein product [Coffea canephora]|uniref:Uncharacterized protein n=1 Tax=Coffea canephora TaxID=49390 RepID=A0A068URM0_COFCA|nr:unnamed protein product [Coffea canephora]
MSAAMAGKSSSKKRGSESDASKSEKLKRVVIEDDFDADLSNDIKEITTALQQIREKAQKDGQKKNEETISRCIQPVFVRMDVKQCELNNTDSRIFYLSALDISCDSYLSCLRIAWRDFAPKYSKLVIQFVVTVIYCSADAISKYEEEKEKLFMRYEQLRKKEKSMIAELENACASRITDLDESLKKKKQDDKTFSILRKTLGSFLDNASDEDFPPDD